MFRSCSPSLLCCLILFLGAFNCAAASLPPDPLGLIGGSIYFSAHPTDGLLYQNPDIFHDLYVYKPVTTVVFTSGDRGIQGNLSQCLERGLENAYSWMIEMPRGDLEWVESSLKVNNNTVLLRSIENLPNVQILYLRLPEGAPTGEGYKVSRKQSLSKLYMKEIETISAIDGSASYTLDSLKELIAKVLHSRKANDIRVLDYKTPMPSDKGQEGDHADHIVTARLVVDVMKQQKISGKLRGYAGGFMKKLKPNLDPKTKAFSIKADALFKYAEHDLQMCKNLSECAAGLKQKSAKLFPNDDLRYVTKWLEREYYVS